MKIETLYGIILDRKNNPQEGSYTNHLLNDQKDKVLQKVGEEAVEVILAAKGQGKQRLIEELSDLAYHSLVLMVAHGVTPVEIEEELERRHH